MALRIFTSLNSHHHPSSKFLLSLTETISHLTLNPHSFPTSSPQPLASANVFSESMNLTILGRYLVQHFVNVMLSI